MSEHTAPRFPMPRAPKGVGEQGFAWGGGDVGGRSGRHLLMLAPSFSRMPVLLVLDARSDPARSTRDSFPIFMDVPPLSLRPTKIWGMGGGRGGARTHPNKQTPRGQVAAVGHWTRRTASNTNRWCNNPLLCVWLPLHRRSGVGLESG
jgi:hypothetical protein